MKDSVTICIGTIGSPTFSKCKEIIYNIFEKHPKVSNICIIENKTPQSAWLNEMRLKSEKSDWCLQVDEDMYLYPNALDELLYFAKKKKEEGSKILNVYSFLHDMFLDKEIGSLKLWNTEPFKKIEFKDVLGGDRIYKDEAKKFGYKNFELHKILADHDSAPTVEIAYKKYFEYTQKLIKFYSIDKAKKFNNDLLKNKDKSEIHMSAYLGSSNGLKSPIFNKSKR